MDALYANMSREQLLKIVKAQHIIINDIMAPAASADTVEDFGTPGNDGFDNVMQEVNKSFETRP